MIIAILIGRAGSTGLPGKNTMDILGRPISEYPLIAASNAKRISKIYVSTDCPEIVKIAKTYNANIIERPRYLCTNQALGEDAYVHAHEIIKNELQKIGKKADIYVLLMANSPTVSTEQIMEGISILEEQPDVDSAVTVSCYNMWSPLRARKINKSGFLDPFVPFETFGDPETLNCDRDSQGDSWFADMGVSVIRPRNLDNLNSGLLPQKWMGEKIRPIKNIGGLDIDYDWQLPQAKNWLRRNKIQERE